MSYGRIASADAGSGGRSPDAPTPTVILARRREYPFSNHTGFAGDEPKGPAPGTAMDARVKPEHEDWG